MLIFCLEVTNKQQSRSVWWCNYLGVGLIFKTLMIYFYILLSSSIIFPRVLGSWYAHFISVNVAE